MRPQRLPPRRRFLQRLGVDGAPDETERGVRLVDLAYTFAFTPPTDRLVAHMETSQAGSVGFDATLSLERRPWNAAEIRRVLVRHPAMTAKVIAEIHWEAFKLWWKGVPVVHAGSRVE